MWARLFRWVCAERCCGEGSARSEGGDVVHRQGADLPAKLEHLSLERRPRRDAGNDEPGRPRRDDVGSVAGARRAGAGRSVQCHLGRRGQPAARGGPLRRTHLERPDLVDEREAELAGFLFDRVPALSGGCAIDAAADSAAARAADKDRVDAAARARIAIFWRARCALGEAAGVRRRFRRLRQARARRARRRRSGRPFVGPHRRGQRVVRRRLSRRFRRRRRAEFHLPLRPGALDRLRRGSGQ